MSDVTDITVGAQIYQGSIAGTRLRFLTGAPLLPGDWTYQAEVAGVPMAALRGLFVYVVQFPDGMGHYIGYRDPFGFGDFDTYPDSFAQVVIFETTRDGAVIPTGVERIVRQQQFVPLIISDISAIGIHVQPFCAIQLVGLVIPS